MDCLLLDGDTDLSSGDRDREAPPLEGSGLREGVKLLRLFSGRLTAPTPWWKGSVTARGRDFGRPGRDVSELDSSVTSLDDGKHTSIRRGQGCLVHSLVVEARTSAGSEIDVYSWGRHLRDVWAEPIVVQHGESIIRALHGSVI